MTTPWTKRLRGGKLLHMTRKVGSRMQVIYRSGSRMWSFMPGDPPPQESRDFDRLSSALAYARKANKI